MDPKVILETVLSREDITAIEALMLMREEGTILKDLLRTAGDINRRVNGNVVTYARSKQVYYTNICRAECSFCSFWKKKGQKGSFVLTPAEVVKQLRDAMPVKQVVVQGGLNPDLSLGYHLEVLDAIRDAYPSIHIHGYSPSEIHFLAKRTRTTSQDILRRFKNAGLDSLSGDSADILNDKVRKKICSDKIRTGDWADIIKTAHRNGITTTATILFGHVEDEIYVCEHLEILKNIQRETGGITSFEPQLFIPYGTDLARSAKIRHPAAADRVLKLYAVARIFLGRLIKTISVDWTKTGFDLGLRALSCGANDLGALTYDPNEIRLPDLNGRGGMQAATVRSAIQKLGKTPAERDPHRVRVPHSTSLPRKEELVLA